MLAVIIACGPSLTQEQVNACYGKAKVYAVNNAYMLAPWADVLYACDDSWWRHYKPEFAGEKWTLSEKAASEFGLNLIGKDSQGFFSTTEGKVCTGYNSGFQALNLAYVQGARKAILLGFDYKDAGNHFFGKHPGQLDRASNMHKWVKFMHQAAPYMKMAGYEVVNATPNSAIQCFPFMRIEDALHKLSHQ
jgi:hypothetical protein